jgi:hypothetical protein
VKSNCRYRFLNNQTTTLGWRSQLSHKTRVPALPFQPALRCIGQANTEGAAKNAYVGAATALSDTTITTKVKAAFASGKDIKSNDIHVTTTAGVVKLSGQVQNSDMAARVVAIARNTKGVRSVTNDLRVPSSASQN